MGETAEAFSSLCRVESSSRNRLCAECGLLREEEGDLPPCELVVDFVGEFSREARSERADDERADDERSTDGELTSLS